jgi:multifunctional beta-oxidation protein
MFAPKKKLGILGLSKATAREGLRHNIRVNTIAPVASTGGLAVALSNTNDKNSAPLYKPEYVVPIVLLLSFSADGQLQQPTKGAGTADDQADHITVTSTTGGLFEVGCGWHASTRLRPSSQYSFAKHSSMTPEMLLSESSWSSNPADYDGNGQAELEKSFFTDVAPRRGNTDALRTIERLKMVDLPQNEYIFTDRDVLLYSKSTKTDHPRVFP